jgi:hypothetical protein
MTEFFRQLPLHDFPDRAHRHLLCHPANLRELIGHALPQLAAALDVEHARPLDRQWPLPDWRRREMDLLFEVPCRPAVAESAALVCIQVEHQSTEDQAMPLRTLLHAVLYWEENWRRWARARPHRRPLRLSLVVPIVFHTGAEPWQAHRTLADLCNVPAGFERFVPVWQPVFWDLAEQSPDALLQAAGAWTQAMAVVRSANADEAVFAQRYADVLHRLEPAHGQDPVRWHELLWFLLSYAVRQRPAQEHANLFNLATSSQTAVAVQEEVRTMEQAVRERWIDWAERHYSQLGAARALREALLYQGRDKFGEPGPEIEAAVAALSDVERLHRIMRRLAHAGTWQQLLETP